MMTPRWPLLAAVTLLLGACGSDGASQSQPRPSATTEPAAVAISAVRDATQNLVDACRAGDSTAVIALVEPEIRTEPWDEGCRAVAAHSLSLTEHEAAVEDATATVHVRLEGAAIVHEEDWYFRQHDDGWQLMHVPPVLTGRWDRDDHQWLQGTPTTASPVHPDGDGHDHTTATTTTAPGHYDGDGHDHTTATTATAPGHYDGDGHAAGESEH